MHTVDALFRLREYQSRILAQIDAALAFLELEPSAAQAGIARARWTMLRLLREYQLFKHGEIFGPAIRCGTERQAMTAHRMQAACVAASDQFTAHVARWSAQDVAARWGEYKSAMRSITDQLRLHAARERREVEELLAGSSHIRRPARA